mmetsp:Transcript_16479/g.23244  ORF Transcript_16479/g.23244 Transcript_16479/m.23244 type:complete len:360 (-) Transcript_16479:91-1170(-)
MMMASAQEGRGMTGMNIYTGSSTEASEQSLDLPPPGTSEIQTKTTTATNESLKTTTTTTTIKEMHFTLTYFRFGGSAEAIRCAFHMGHIDFEDFRISHREFETERDSGALPYGQLPVLDVTTTTRMTRTRTTKTTDDVSKIDTTVTTAPPSPHITTDTSSSAETIRLPQSTAILRFVGKLAKLYPEDALTALRCDALIDAVQDFNEALRPTIKPYKSELNEDDWWSMRWELGTFTIPLWLRRVSFQLSEEGPFALGKEICICDLALYVIFKWLGMGLLDGIPNDLVQQHDRLIVFMDAVKHEPRVASFYKDEKVKLAEAAAIEAKAAKAVQANLKPTRGASPLQQQQQQQQQQKANGYS